ncbi:MAG TPA: pyridoxamine 5'-phosphate oxidase family protein [Candidatus Nanopelagicales bacterium]|jgi:hypothetical protein
MNTSDVATILSDSECWKLLRSTEVGRLGLCGTHGPEIFPVNFVVDHGTLVFRTAVGTKLAMVDATSAVAFEADGYDTATQQVWSVVVKGDASVVRNVEDVMSTTDLPLFPWHGSAKSTFVRIVPTTFTGRRFRVVDGSVWASLLSGARPTAPE